MITRIPVREPYRSNFKEVMRHIVDHQDEDIAQPHTFAIRTLVNWYVAQYPDDFKEKDHQIVYLGGDSTKGSLPDDNQEDDDSSITFSMEEGPPSGA